MKKDNNNIGNNNGKNYPVGYGKPPVEYQWKKDESGNPKGRPIHSKNMRSIFEEVFFDIESIRINGKQQKMSSFKILLMNLKRAAYQNDSKAISKIMEYAVKLGFLKEPDPKDCPNCKGRQVGCVVVPAGVPAEMWEELYGEKAKGTYRPHIESLQKD